MTNLVHIAFEDKGLTRICLNRPEKLNAFSHALMDDFLDVLDEVKSGIRERKTRVVLLHSSTPKAFSAGADLSERSKMDETLVAQTLDKQRRIVDGVAALECPTIAAIEGVAFGGGLELALACDLRIASQDSKMGLTETRLGVIPGAGGTQRLSRTVGMARAKELIFLAKRLSGPEAEKIGLVHATKLDAMAEALKWAEEITRSGPLAQSAAKKAIDEGISLTLSEALDTERRCYDVVLKSNDRIEGLAAFLEKRAPNFRGH